MLVSYSRRNALSEGCVCAPCWSLTREIQRMHWVRCIRLEREPGFVLPLDKAALTRDIQISHVCDILARMRAQECTRAVVEPRAQIVPAHKVGPVGVGAVFTALHHNACI